MYHMDSDTYVCDICGTQFRWEEAKEDYGEIWECERCAKHFCTRCFTKAHGITAFSEMLQGEMVSCPECYRKSIEKLSVWVRLGATLSMSKEEADIIFGEDRVLAKKCFARLLNEGGFILNGNCYAPEECVAEMNQKHETNYDFPRLDFDI